MERRKREGEDCKVKKRKGIYRNVKTRNRKRKELKGKRTRNNRRGENLNRVRREHTIVLG